MEEPKKGWVALDIYRQLEKLSILHKIALTAGAAVLFTGIGLAVGPRLFKNTSGQQNEKTITVQGEIIERHDESAPLPRLILRSDEAVYELFGEKNIELSKFINKKVEIKGHLIGNSEGNKLKVIEYRLTQEAPKEETIKISGTIQPKIFEDEGKGTHLLKDEAGVVVAYLTTDDDKLKISEGVFAQVEGRILEAEKDTPPLIEVEKISFK